MKKIFVSTLLLLSSLCFAQVTQVDVDAATFGIDSLAVPANGSSFGNEIDARGFTKFSVFDNCTGGTYSLRWRVFDADGVLQTGGSLATSMVPGVGYTTVVNSEGDPTQFSANGSAATINPLFKVRGPFRKVQVGFLSSGPALTCTATLIMQ